jgi:hypothetical protein
MHGQFSSLATRLTYQNETIFANIYPFERPITAHRFLHCPAAMEVEAIVSFLTSRRVVEALPFNNSEIRCNERLLSDTDMV